MAICLESQISLYVPSMQVRELTKLVPKKVHCLQFVYLCKLNHAGDYPGHSTTAVHGGLVLVLGLTST